jgi:RNA polymerase sigma factor (sigma-70 family)
MAISDQGTDAGKFLATRHSLLSRLRNWGDEAGWREFFDSYWRFIYSVARRSGLSDDDAQDVVQEVLTGVARKMPGFHYDRTKSFKGWLMVQIRSRIVEHHRRTAAKRSVTQALPESETLLEAIRVDDSVDPPFEAVWDKEWRQHMLETALRRVEAKVSARQFLIFSHVALRGDSVTQVRKTLGVSLAQVYLAKHRVGKLVKEELRLLEAAD